MLKTFLFHNSLLYWPDPTSIVEEIKVCVDTFRFLFSFFTEGTVTCNFLFAFYVDKNSKTTISSKILEEEKMSFTKANFPFQS